MSDDNNRNNRKKKNLEAMEKVSSAVGHTRKSVERAYRPPKSSKKK